VFAQLRTRLFLSSLVTVAIVVGLLAFILYIQLRFNQRVQTLNELRNAMSSARELSLYTQYNAHDTNAYALGHLEHLAEFKEHSAAFAAALTGLEQSLQAGILDEDEQEQIEQLRATRLEYDRASQALFATADAHRGAPSEANQAAADIAWEQADRLGDQLDQESQELARRIAEDIEQLLPEIAVSNQQIILTGVFLGSLLIALLLLVQGMAARTVGAPLRALLAGVQAFAAGDLATRIAIKRRDEIGELSAAFNRMAASLQEQRQALEAQNQELQGSLQTQQQLFATVQQLAVPLLPIGQGAVLLPIIGHVDAARAETMLQTLLHSVAHQRAFCVILDVTGIAVINAEILRLLMQMIEATELLGAKVLVAGITGVMAQAIVVQDVCVDRLRTYRDLGSAIEAAQSLRTLRNGAALVS
jgi:HAMP domain-containing protein/anti-anti-sigma regulatory factor